ncbi:cytochrome P450 3A6-like [Rhipicephalus sanguineus]|uniref:cytochrome P450 3A6-like n=1 Tax=Rhipicephalus sanguineus TaxID=34632 RepID=UPI0020C1EA20|nr:cytochrome P450 3A6-like [Rhipicephalus sanguineus]
MPALPFSHSRTQFTYAFNQQGASDTVNILATPLAVPGPKPDLLWGNWKQLKKDRIRVMEQWIQCYGKVFGIYLGDKPFMVITDVELVKECFVKTTKAFQDRPMWAQRLCPLRRGLFGEHPTPPKRRANWRASSAYWVGCQTNSNDGALKSFEVIFREADSALFESAFAYPGLYSILQRLYPFTSFSKALQKVMDDALITLNKRRSGEEGRKEDVLQHVIDAQEGVGNVLPTASANVRFIDDHILVCNLAILILAGYDTTSASLAFLLYLLAKHPEEQLKIRAEIVSALRHKENSDRQAFAETERTATNFDAKQDLEREGWQPSHNVPDLSPPHATNDVVSEAVSSVHEALHDIYGQRADVPQASSNAETGENELDEDDVMQLQRLDMVVREGLRLYPPIPINVMRECTEDTTILCQFIPAGTSVLAPPWHIHRNEEMWPEPDRFVPERFAPEHRDNVASSYYPFGLGPRTCVAHRLAMVTLKTALYRLVRNFDISLAEDLPDPLPIWVHNVVLNPKVAIKLTVTRSNIKQIQRQ